MRFFIFITCAFLLMQEEYSDLGGGMQLKGGGILIIILNFTDGLTPLERIDTSRQKSTRNAETQTISTLSDNRFEISRYGAQEIRTLNFNLSDKARSLSSTSDEIQGVQRDSVKGRDVQISDFEIHNGQDMEIHTGKVGNGGGR